MKPKKQTILALWIFVTLMFGLTACGTNPAEEAPSEMSAGEAALKVTGAVFNEQAWTEDEVKGMDAIDNHEQQRRGKHVYRRFTRRLAVACPT